MIPDWRCACTRIAVTLLLCAASCAQAPPQPVQLSGPDTVLQLHGTVINGVTGKPIARALVVSADQRLATLTDENGQFAIDIAVPAPPTNAGARGGFARFTQMVNLTAKKPGFAAPVFQANLALDETLSSKSVELKLMPTASVSGHVSADVTDTPGGVRVSLLRHQIEDGRHMWNFAGNQSTDSRGEFHFENLEPGEYTLITGDWGGEQGEMQPAKPDASRPIERYAPVFYGDVNGLAESTKMHLHYGDSIRAEIHLHKVRYFPVAIPLHAGGDRPGVSISFAGADFFKAFRMRYNTEQGTVTGDLPDGSYTMLLGGNLPTGEQQFAQVALHVSGASVRTAPVTLAPAPKIQVRVHKEFTASQNQRGVDFTDELPTRLNARYGAGNEMMTPPPLQMFLRSAEEGNRMGGNAKATGADELVIENLQPGRYYVQAMPMGIGYVASMTADGVDLLQQPLVVRPDGGAGPIDVTLRDDMARISVTFTEDLAPHSGGAVSLYFLPDGGGNAQMSFAIAGRFPNASSLAPGSYHVLAFRGPPQNFAFREQETVRQFAGKGVAVTASPGQTVQVEVPVLDDPQAMEAP